MLLQLNLFSQATPQLTAPFTLSGKILLNEKPAENVSLELFKNGQLIKKIVTTKNGKYAFVMYQDTLNRENEYIIHVSKEATVSKTIVINTYIPKEEYDDNNYDYLLEITLLPTKLNDIVIQWPSGKIKWNTAEKSYGIDKVYAKVIQKEEDKLKRDPDKYLKELAEKMRKEEEEKKKKVAETEAKKKTETEAKKKADEEAINQIEELARKNKEEDKERAKLKEQEAIEQALKENVLAIKIKLKELSVANDSIQHHEVNEVIASTLDETRVESYEHATQYPLKKAKVEVEKRKQLQEKKKSANQVAKYQTRNVMSSLLDVVDEHEKNKE